MFPNVGGLSSGCARAALAGRPQRLEEAQARVPNVVICHSEWPDREAPECAQTLRELADLHERFFVPQKPEPAA